MSQSEVIDILEAHKKPMSRTEIAKILNVNAVIVSHSIMRLVKNKGVKIIEIDREQAMKYYNCKRRMRLYYL